MAFSCYGHMEAKMKGVAGGGVTGTEVCGGRRSHREEGCGSGRSQGVAVALLYHVRELW